MLLHSVVKHVGMESAGVPTTDTVIHPLYEQGHVLTYCDSSADELEWSADQAKESPRMEVPSIKSGVRCGPSWGKF